MSDDEDISPRPRPGWRSRREPMNVHAGPQMFAATLGGSLGVVALATALLFLPPHMITPILAGVSILMITRGAFGAWKVGVAEERLRPLGRAIAWGLPAAAVVVLLLTAVLGAGSFAPDMRALSGRPAPVPTITFEPAPSGTGRGR